MEQILVFVLGVSAALLVWGVVVAFKTASKVREIEKQFQALYTELSQRDELVNRRIDQEIDRVNQITNDCIRYTDSRIDKLESKVVANYGAKEILKG